MFPTLLTSRAGAIIRNAPKKQNHFFRLPPELRVTIYKYALHDSTFDEESQSHVYEIGERRRQRQHNINNRLNNYTLLNIPYNHFALLRTGRQVNQEIKSCLNLSASFSFSHPRALAVFACGPLAKAYCGVDSMDAELHGFLVLCQGENLKGNLRNLAAAEEIRVFNGSAAREPNVMRILGRACLSVGEDCWLR